MKQVNIKLTVSCALGLLTPFMARALSGAMKNWETVFVYIFPFVAIFIFAWLVATWVESKSKTAVVLFFFMIPVGVLVDVVIDGAFNKVDRNLFPFEILFWIILAPLPIWIGYLLRLKRKSGSN